MATALICDMCEAEQADIIVTNLGNGDTLAIGQNCLPDFARNLIGEVAPLDPPEGGEGERVDWPGEVDLDGLPPGMDATMAKAWKEAEEQALAELQAEAEAEAARNAQEADGGVEGEDTPDEASEAVSGAHSEPETAV